MTVTTASTTGTITDNDTLTAAVTADAAAVTEDQSATFTVALTGGTSTADVVVDYSLVGTATADDYTAPSGKLTIETPVPVPRSRSRRCRTTCWIAARRWR